MGSLFNKIVETKQIKLWKTASNRAEYEKVRRVIGGTDLKSTLDSKMINDAMLSQGITSVSTQESLILIHDPCDIRKAYSKLSDGLGKVRDLKQNIINGYSSFNSIAIDTKQKKVTLLANTIYSNKIKQYVSESEIKKQQKSCHEDATDEEKKRYTTVSELIASDTYININKILRDQLSELSQKIKSESSIKVITHVLDREFDSLSNFKFIDNEINDEFVIRMKAARISSESIMKSADNCIVIILSEKELYKITDGGIIINDGICYTQSRRKTDKIIYCDGDISEFLEYNNYTKNKTLTKSLSQINICLPLCEASITDWYLNHVKKRVPIKLVTQQFPNSIVKSYDKLIIKNKVYQNAQVLVDYGIALDNEQIDTDEDISNAINKYQVVRIQIIDREGKLIFKQPMLLATNKTVNNSEQAFNIYYTYLRRSKIESVFKFLKDVLGWEDCQIQDFNSMKTLLTFCYFVAAYFYEIESVLIKDPMIKYLAFLGNGKGKVTRTYVLRGVVKLLDKYIVDQWIEEYEITPEMLQDMLKLARVGI